LLHLLILVPPLLGMLRPCTFTFTCTCIAHAHDLSTCALHGTLLLLPLPLLMLCCCLQPLSAWQCGGPSSPCWLRQLSATPPAAFGYTPGTLSYNPLTCWCSRCLGSSTSSSQLLRQQLSATHLAPSATPPSLPHRELGLCCRHGGAPDVRLVLALHGQVRHVPAVHPTF